MSLKISRILHAGYVFEHQTIEHQTTLVAFDPIFENPFSRNCYAFPSVEFDLEKIKRLKFSAVFISHFHDDHCSLESLDLLDRSTPIYIYCLFAELPLMIQELGFLYVYSLKIDEPVQIGSIEIIPHRALDEDVDSIFQIRAGEFNVLNVVDSWIDPFTLEKLVQEGPWDMVMWPFQTMRELEVLAPSRVLPSPVELPEEWLPQLKKLNPRYLVPSSCQFVQESWSWYNHYLFPITYKQFKTEIEAAMPAVQVVRFNPSVSFNLTKEALEPSEALEWIQPVGLQDLDYEYKPKLVWPNTAEISKNFVPLTAQQKERVDVYCRVGLVEKYLSLEPSAEVYFDKPRLWRLSVYDHTGFVQHFYYQLSLFKQKMEIQRLERCEGVLAWTTEIPLARFYGALELGESLTSLYLRINDFVFDPDTEKEINSVDIIEDPLIRCLFCGEFGAYQRAQLDRILGPQK